jgi:hypothetical protein
MPKAPATVPSLHLHIKLEAEYKTQLETYLWSDLEGRVPKGAYKEWIEARIRDFFGGGVLEVAPGEYVRGDQRTIHLLKMKMEGVKDDN